MPFLEGQHQEVDPKILPDGYLSACKNVRLRKDGRFGVRADFDAIGNTTQNTAPLVPYDLIGFDEGLLAIGDGNGFSGDTAPWDIAALTSTTPSTWRMTSQTGGFTRIGRVSHLREIAGLPSGSISSAVTSVSRIDCAAANGLVCLAMQVSSTRVFFHIMRASTGATVLEHHPSGIRPRVVVVNGVFFLLYLGTTPNVLHLASFNPAVDTAAQVLADLSSGTTIACYDAATNLAGNGFWLGLNLAGPTTSITPVNSSGVAGSPITGPAVAYQHLAVRETTTRVHLLSVIAAGATQLRSYTTGGSLSTGPTTIIATTNDRQPGLTNATFAGTEGVEIALEPTVATYVGFAAWYKINALTHATISSAPLMISNAHLGGKPAVSGAINYHHFFPYVKVDGAFLSHGVASGDTDSNILTYVYKDRFSAVASDPDTTPAVALDASTGKWYWPNLFLGADGHASPRITEFDFGSNARRQTATIAGKLYLASGIVQTFDGKTLMESGFFEKPTILSATPSNGAGSLPSSTTLLVAAVFEWIDRQGDLRQSDISDVTTVTMGVADDIITLSIAGPIGNKGSEGPINVVAYRSIDGISQLRRCESAQTYTAGSAVALTLLLADSVVRANGVIYTQAGRAALGAILPDEAPLAADYICKLGDRLLAATADGAQVSKEIFPGFEVEWSGAEGFLIPKVSDRITGVGALDQRGFLFSSERIFQFSGDGPNDAGENRFSEPTLVPGSTGLMTWQSLVETPIGLFFQGSNGQLWVLPRDGSPPVWIGQPVRDVLVAYPAVTSATLVTKEQLVSFTCNNTGGTDCRIVSYDLRAKTWIVDEFGSATPITAACSYSGRLAYISAGIVYTEKTSLTPGTFIEHSLTTGRVKPFGSEWGKFCTIGLVGEYRGDCLLRCKVSYDDGKTFTTMGTVFSLLASGGLAVGDSIEREWNPARRKAEHLKVLFEAITAGVASEGFVFNKWRLATQPSQGMSRSPAAQRG